MTTPPLQTTLTINKKLLRKRIGSTLRALPSAAIQTQSHAIAIKLFATPLFRRCQHVSCYLSMPTGEVDTTGIIQEVIKSGKSLYVPKIDKSSTRRMDMMKIYDYDDLYSLPSGVWGIKEPDDQYKEGKRLSTFDMEADPLDLVLLPGMAFDRGLSRLGHGKGYYDHFISSYISSGRPRPTLVALALREQLLDTGEVPMGQYDWKMDAIITEDEFVTVDMTHELEGFPDSWYCRSIEVDVTAL